MRICVLGERGFREAAGVRARGGRDSSGNMSTIKLLLL